MADLTTKQSVLFDELADRPVHAVFDQEAASTDGGAILLRAAERRVDLLGPLAACLPDEREPGKVRHELEELVGQRVYALATGYPDCNDAARLRDDPVHKMCWWAERRSKAVPWPPSRRCLASKTPRPPSTCMAWRRRWPSE